MASAVGVPLPAGVSAVMALFICGSVHRRDLDVDGAGDAAGAVVHRVGVRLGERLHPPGDRALRGADHRLQRGDDDLPLGRRAARRRAVGDVDHRARPIEHHQDVRRLGGRLELQEAAVRISGVADPDVTAAAGRAEPPPVPVATLPPEPTLPPCRCCRRCHRRWRRFPLRPRRSAPVWFLRIPPGRERRRATGSARRASSSRPPTGPRQHPQATSAAPQIREALCRAKIGPPETDHPSGESFGA